MPHVMTCGDDSNCTWTDLAIPTIARVNCANTGKGISNSSAIIRDAP